MWSLHVLSVLLRVSSGYSGVHYKTENFRTWKLETDTMPVGVNVCVIDQ